MDLDHVCSLHKRWFRNLRVVTQRPDYVEYRLTSLFYGLKQETTARGGPVDQNRYWYEFITPLAKMRVDGVMEGPDGNLIQTENIAFDFHWCLAPAFWLLRPLFLRQKQDILSDDSALLERVYELDARGFRRQEPDLPKVVVYGGDGFFGRFVVEDLLRFSSAEIIVASRHPRDSVFENSGTRIRKFESDANDYASVLSTIEGATVVVSCVGPYQGRSLNLLRACMEKRIAYVDIADDRDFVARCHRLSSEIEKAGIAAFVGCSVVPGISSLLTRYCQSDVPFIDQTRTFISPGTRHPRGRGSFLCLLSTVGNEFSVPSGDGQRIVRGWTERELVTFPPPMGNRHVYSVVDIADYFLQPIYFGVKNVVFKIGSELDFLNGSLSALRTVKRSLNLKSMEWLLPISNMLVYGASLFGTSQGGVMVEVSGGSPQRMVVISVFAAERGEVIPALLPSLATQMLLRREISTCGIVSLPDWLSRDTFLEELTRRGLQMAANRDGVWSVANRADSLH